MAIVQQETPFDGRTFIVTTSDQGYMIENENGELYAEAWDLPTASHTYTETTVPIDDPDPEEVDALYAQAGRIMLGEGE